MCYFLRMRIRLKPLTIARIFEIPVKVSYGWLPIFGLHVYAVSVYYLPRHLHGLRSLEYWILGLVTTLLLFLSVLGHEVGHALSARAEGLHIHDITLHLFGGLARFDREAPTPLADFKIGVAGPATSFFYGLLFFLLNLMSVYLYPTRPAALLTNYLALTNLILAVFNLLPGYPLDGGRILRAWLWHRSGDFLAATRWAIQAGRGIAYFLIAWGAFWIITGRTGADLFIGVWAIFVGVFLRDAAEGSFRSWRSLYQARTLCVADAMHQSVTLSPDMTIEELIDRVLPQHRQTSFPVLDQQRFVGIVSLERLRSIPRQRWAQVTTRQVMYPVSARLALDPQMPLSDAEALLRENHVGSAGVVDEQGRLVGFIGLGEIRKRLAS